MHETNKQSAMAVFYQAVKAVQPFALIPRHLSCEDGNLTICGQTLPISDFDSIYVLAVGKAAAAMAQEAEKILGNKIAAGLVITKYQHSLPLQYLQTLQAGHPVPDENSFTAAIAVRGLLKRLTQNSLLLCLVSGGASALLADVAEGITLVDLQNLSIQLLQSGADIHEINTLRKHICFLKGGQLVYLTNGASIFSLIISDVPGDDLSSIASGLTVPDPTSFGDAWQVLDKYGLVEKTPTSIKKHLLQGINNLVKETPKPGAAFFSTVTNTIIGNNSLALQAAALHAEKLGFTTLVADDLLHGEAKDAALGFVNTLLQYKGKRPACFLAGGETTVTIRGNGKGGRNQEFALAALCELQRRDLPPNQWPVILAAGTDGTDGPTPAAGAIVSINNFTNMNNLALNATIFLQNNDSFHFFETLGALVITGPTQTNVMDIAVGIIC